MTPAIDFRREFLENNLALLTLPMRTRELVEAATPRGSLRHRAGGAPVIELEGCTLGAPHEQPLELGTSTPGSTGVVVVFGIGLGHTVRAVRAATRSTT
jgi:hypothetical protein